MNKRGKIIISLLIIFVALFTLSFYLVLADSATISKSYDSKTDTLSIKSGANDLAKIKLDAVVTMRIRKALKSLCRSSSRCWSSGIEVSS